MRKRTVTLPLVLTAAVSAMANPAITDKTSTKTLQRLSILKKS